MTFARKDIKVNHITEKLTSSKCITTEDVIGELTLLGKNLSNIFKLKNVTGDLVHSIFIPELLAAVKSTLVLPQSPQSPQSQAITLASNIAGSALQIVIGSVQCYSALTSDTHQPIYTGIEGVINIAKGAQLIVLLAISISLGAIGCAVAASVAAAFSVKNAIESFRKYLDDDFWIQDSLEVLTLSRKKHRKELFAKQEQINKMYSEIEAAALAKNEEQLLLDEIYDLNDKAPSDQKLSPETLNFVTGVILRFIKDRLVESDNSIKNLQTDIFARLVTNYVEKGNESYLCNNFLDNNDSNQFTKSQQDCLININYNRQLRLKYGQPELKEKRKEYVNALLKKEYDKQIAANGKPPKNFFKSYEECEKATQASKEECKQETILNAIDAFYMIMAAAGTICLCTPGAQVLAAFFIAPAAGYFIAKYSVHIASFVSSVHSFFSKSNNTKKPEQPEQQEVDKATMGADTNTSGLMAFAIN